MIVQLERVWCTNGLRRFYRRTYESVAFFFKENQCPNYIRIKYFVRASHLNGMIWHITQFLHVPLISGMLNFDISHNHEYRTSIGNRSHCLDYANMLHFTLWNICTGCGRSYIWGRPEAKWGFIWEISLPFTGGALTPHSPRVWSGTHILTLCIPIWSTISNLQNWSSKIGAPKLGST